VHFDDAFFKDQSEIVNFLCVEFAFLQFQIEVMFFESFQHLECSCTMESRIRGVNQEVIHIDDEPSFSLVILEYVIHQCLECRRRIA
ncbi:hypothetical protein PAXINDRAFT_85878, partial [Paxillus involutus ATCC 200175]